MFNFPFFLSNSALATGISIFVFFLAVGCPSEKCQGGPEVQCPDPEDGSNVKNPCRYKACAREEVCRLCHCDGECRAFCEPR